MKDITESLRIMAGNLKYTSGQHTADLLNEAADKIEELRKEIVRLSEGDEYNQFGALT